MRRDLCRCLSSSLTDSFTCMQWSFRMWIFLARSDVELVRKLCFDRIWWVYICWLWCRVVFAMQMCVFLWITNQLSINVVDKHVLTATNLRACVLLSCICFRPLITEPSFHVIGNILILLETYTKLTWVIYEPLLTITTVYYYYQLIYIIKKSKFFKKSYSVQAYFHVFNFMVRLPCFIVHLP